MTVQKTKIIGLTGGIASGKSAASDFLASLGVSVVDADILAKESLAAGSEGAGLVAKAFVDAVDAKGNIDRAKLRQIVFGNPKNADKLDKILHPIIVGLIKTELDKYTNRGVETVVLVAPLLFELGLETLCDKTIQISAPADIRLNRAMVRDNVHEDNIRAIMARQLSDEDRERRSDKTVHNTGSLTEFQKKIITLVR